MVGRGRKGVFSTRPAKAPLNLGTGGWEPAAAPGHLRSQQRRVRDRGPAGGSSLKPHVAWATPASPGPSREMGRSRAERTGTGDYRDPAERSALGAGLPTVPVRMGHRNHRASETLGRPGRQQEGPSERSARRHSAARGGASARCASCCVLLPCGELCVAVQDGCTGHLGLQGRCSASWFGLTSGSPRARPGAAASPDPGLRVARPRKRWGAGEGPEQGPHRLPDSRSQPQPPPSRQRSCPLKLSGASGGRSRVKRRTKLGGGFAPPPPSQEGGTSAGVCAGKGGPWGARHRDRGALVGVHLD